MQRFLPDEVNTKFEFLESTRGAALALSGVIFAACLFGIYTRPLGLLANVWPANAIMLGFLLRNPAAASPLGWIGGAVAYMAADLLTGSTLLKASLLNSANLVGIAAAYAVYMRFPPGVIRLQQPTSMLYLAAAAAVAAAATAVVGGAANPILFGRGIVSGWTLWFATEFVNYITILPLLLSAPSLRHSALRRSLNYGLRRRGDGLPAVVLVFSCVAAVFVGGPGALAFPVPALLWCGLVYPVFPTAVLTFLYGLWTMVVISTSYLPNYGEHFDEMVLASIRMGASLIAVAPIMLAGIMQGRNELLARLNEMATHDQLTGAYNRGAFREQALRFLAERQKERVAVLMIDLDHFKAVNDTYGHAGGDTVLTTFATRTRNCLRVGDMLGRLGGEEFAVLLPNCAEGDAVRIANRIREGMCEIPVTLPDGRSAVVTASIGVAMLAGDDMTCLDQLLYNADSALYKAKSGGRNMVQTAAGAGESSSS